MMIRKEHWQLLQHVKATHGEFSHALVVADMDKKNMRKEVRKTCVERREIGLLKYVKIRKQVEEEEIELANIDIPNLSEHFKDVVLRACDMCWKKRVGEVMKMHGVRMRR